MITGKIYITILEKNKRRVTCISFSDENLDQSIVIPFEINSQVSKNYAYYCLINTSLKQYIKLVSDKNWIKYDNMIILLDKEARTNRGKKLANQKFIEDTDNFIKLVGGVKFKKAKEDDPYYMACVGSAYNYINKFLGVKDGSGSTSESN